MQRTIERFNQYVSPDPNGGCWLWVGGYFDVGMHYGRFWFKGRNRAAHRVAYQLFVGRIPDGLLVCHECDIPICVNPAHLWLGTALDNARDRDAKGRGARGVRNGAHTHPELIRRGPDHHWHTKPETRPFGDRNGSRTHPEKRPRGTGNSRARLTDGIVRSIHILYASGLSQQEIGDQFGVTQNAISSVLLRKTWRHVEVP